MVKESKTVTKKYSTDALREQRTDVIREVRVMMHEIMTGGMENMKLYYEEQGNRHMAILSQGFKDEMKTLIEKLENHEVRIATLEIV